MKISTVFLRDECILPSRFALRQEPFSKGWAEAMGTEATELDARIRSVGWHFMWLADSHSSQAFGRTAETAIHRALARTLPAVRGQFNAAELDSVHVRNFAGFHIARVTVNARQIQSAGFAALTRRITSPRLHSLMASTFAIDGSVLCYVLPPGRPPQYAQYAHPSRKFAIVPFESMARHLR